MSEYLKELIKGTVFVLAHRTVLTTLGQFTEEKQASHPSC